MDEKVLKLECLRLAESIAPKLLKSEYTASSIAGIIPYTNEKDSGVVVGIATRFYNWIVEES